MKKTKKEVTFFTNGASLAANIGNEYKGKPCLNITLPVKDSTIPFMMFPVKVGTSTVLNFNKTKMNLLGIREGTKLIMTIEELIV